MQRGCFPGQGSAALYTTDPPRKGVHYIGGQYVSAHRLPSPEPSVTQGHRTRRAPRLHPPEGRNVAAGAHGAGGRAESRHGHLPARLRPERVPRASLPQRVGGGHEGLRHPDGSGADGSRQGHGRAQQRRVPAGEEILLLHEPQLGLCRLVQRLWLATNRISAEEPLALEPAASRSG